jgi:HEAT repeat protein
MMHDEKNRGVEVNVSQALWDIGPVRKSGVQEWLVLIKDQDLYIRLYAAFALGYYKPLVQQKPIVQALTEATHDVDVTVGWMAARGLARLGPIAATAVPTLTEIVRAKNSPLCAEALRALGRIGPDAVGAVPEILAVLYGAKDYGLYLDAAMALGHIGPKILPLLESELKSHPLHILEVVKHLGTAGTPLVVEALRMHDNKVRKEAMDVVSWLGPGAEATVPLLIEELDDRDTKMRQQAALALESLGPRAQAAVPQLIVRLKDKDAMVQCSSAEALGAIGAAAEPAIPGLVRVMKLKTTAGHEIPQVCAAEALVKMGPDAKALVPPDMIKRVEERAEEMSKYSPFQPDPTQPTKPKPPAKPSRTY